ncbi:unnamed protein product, partial [Didymodactylos carnosus]
QAPPQRIPPTSALKPDKENVDNSIQSPRKPIEEQIQDKNTDSTIDEVQHSKPTETVLASQKDATEQQSEITTANEPNQDLSLSKTPLDSAQKIVEQPPESGKSPPDVTEPKAVESTSITTEKIELPSTKTEVAAADRHHYEDTIAKPQADVAKVR